MHALRKSNWISQLACILVKRRLMGLFLAVLVILICMSGLRLIKLENNYRSYVGEDNEALKVSDWLSDRRGDEQETVILIYSAADKNVFSEQSLLQYVYIAREAKRLPNVSRVQSLLDTRKQVFLNKKTGRDKYTEYREAPFTFGADIFTPDGRDVLRHDALSLPTVNRRFVGDDGASAAVILFLNFNDESSWREQLINFYSEVNALNSSLKIENSEDEIRLAGASLFDHAASQVLSDDIRRIFPMALLLIAIVFFLIYRSVLFIPAALIIIFTPVFATAGLAGHFGLDLSNLSVSGLLLVGTLAVADIMHISNSHFKQISIGIDREEALTSALKSNIRVVTVTTLTTSIGQAALILSAAKPIQVMGWIIVMGSWLALVLVLLILPAVLMFITPRSNTPLQKLSIILGKISLIGFRFPIPIILMSCCIIFVFVFAIIQTKLTDSLTGWFGEDTAYRQGMELLDTHYLGGNTISFAIEALNDDLVAAKNLPTVSDNIDLYQELKQGISKVGGDGKWFDPVGTGDAVATLLNGNQKSSLLINDAKYFEMLTKFSTETVAHSGLMTRYQPGKTDYSLWFFDSDISSSFELETLAVDLSNKFKQLAEGREIRTGGIGLALAQLSTANFLGVLHGSLYTLILISAVLFFVFGSCKLGFISIFPNIAPLIIAFGIWALSHGYFNLASITVFSIALGVIVDDTIHIIMKYKYNLAHSNNSQRAFILAINECGVGVFATTVVIGLGFLLLGTSDFLLTSQKMLLASIAIVIAFIFDILILPSIIALSEKGCCQVNSQ